jgi:protein-tyrosine phosphatase
MAQAVLTKHVSDAGLTRQISVQSAGTHASRLGEKVDHRAEASLKQRGYDLGRFRSRRVSPADFEKFDWILAMDLENLDVLRKASPPEHLDKIRLYLNHASNNSNSSALSVPDPYYGNAEGFDSVLDLCEAGAVDWMSQLKNVLTGGVARPHRP